MQKEQINIWQPNYISSFQCDGSKCNSLCCRNAWDIVIDEVTYEKYRALPEADRARVLAAVEARRGAEGYRIKFDAQHACPLLRADKRCALQAKYGCELLSEVCMTYPRKVVQLSLFQLRILSMTCPVAAELALFGTGGMEFAQVEPQPDYGWRILEEKQMVELPQMGKLVKALIVSCVRILQDVSYSWEERLLLLGLYLDRADELREADEPERRLAELGRFYHTAEFRSSVADFLAELAFCPEENRRYWQALLKDLQDKDILATTDVLRQGAEGYCEKPLQLDATFNRAMDNFLVQEFLYQGYPFRVEGSFLHNYLVFLQSISLWPVMLAGKLAETGGRLCKEAFIALAGEYCYTADHKLEFISCLAQRAEQYADDPVRLMQLLLRLC